MPRCFRIALLPPLAVIQSVRLDDRFVTVGASNARADAALENHQFVTETNIAAARIQTIPQHWFDPSLRTGYVAGGRYARGGYF